MARTEKVIMTNMCMVFSENRILVQDKTDDDYSGITFPGGDRKSTRLNSSHASKSRMPSSA